MACDQGRPFSDYFLHCNLLKIVYIVNKYIKGNCRYITELFLKYIVTCAYGNASKQVTSKQQHAYELFQWRPSRFSMR